jgi:hypothetical protein
MPSVSLQDFLSRHTTASTDCSLRSLPCLEGSMTTSISSRRLRSFDHTWLLAGPPDSASSFCLQVGHDPLAREERARKSRDFFLFSWPFSLSLTSVVAPYCGNLASRIFFLFFAGLVIGTISYFTRSLFSDDVGFAVDHVVVWPRPDFG